MRSRENRIHHRERLKLKRRFHFGQDLMFEENTKTKSVVDTPTPCSCWMCGNPRKYFNEKTLQETSFDNLFKSLE